MDAIIDDLTGQQINKADSWKVKIRQPNGLTIEVDCLPDAQIKNIVSVAVSNKQRWFKWKKEGDRLTKVYPDEEGF